MMTPDAIETIYTQLVEILRQAVGEARAQTLDMLCDRLQVRRRNLEILIEARLSDIPFLVVAGSAGYYRPSSAAQVNAYLASLESRNRRIFMRRRTTIQKALAEGYPREGRSFRDRPTLQQEFDLCSPLAKTESTAPCLS